MKSTQLNLICAFIILLFGMNSCVEEEQAVDYTFINKSDYNIKIVRYGGYDYNYRDEDTIVLDRETQIIFNYSGKGGTGPFCTIDSLGFFSGDKIKQKYRINTLGKNPFNLDYYTGGKKDYKRHVTYSQYTYLIENSDFNLK